MTFFAPIYYEYLYNHWFFFAINNGFAENLAFR